MAAITTVVTGNPGPKRIRTAAAQATTGQTDWVAVPRGAKGATIWVNITANAGATPSTTISVLTTDPITRDDSYTVNVAEHTSLTAITAASMLVIDIGPGVTGIADDVTNAAAASSYVKINAHLPPILGIKVLNDRGDGNETYTYTVTVAFHI